VAVDTITYVEFLEVDEVWRDCHRRALTALGGDKPRPAPDALDIAATAARLADARTKRIVGGDAWHRYSTERGRRRRRRRPADKLANPFTSRER